MAVKKWVRFPHTFKIYRDDGADQVPPVENKRLLLEGICNVEVNNSGSMKNTQEAMLYDYVLFHKEDIIESIKVNDSIECEVFGKTINGIIKKDFAGQLTKRIWFNEVSS